MPPEISGSRSLKELNNVHHTMEEKTGKEERKYMTKSGPTKADTKRKIGSQVREQGKGDNSGRKKGQH